MKAIEIKNLSKSFGGVQAVENVSLVVETGEKHAIIGPNGAGKTTLLNLIGGLYTADHGEIHVLGHDITNLTACDRIKHGVARTFQLTSVFLDLTVLDNVLLSVQAIKPYRFGIFRPQKTYGDLLDRAHWFLSQWGMWEKRHSMLRILSYGEQRKVELIMGLASDPRILLLDEPTCGLTMDESADFAELITAAGRNITLLIVEHDMDIVFKVATKITVLHHGTVLVEGTPLEIAEHERVREIYLGQKNPLRN